MLLPGDDSYYETTKRGLEYSRTFTFDVPNNFEDITQVDFVVFLTDPVANAINVRTSSLGEVLDYELLE